MVAFRLFPVGIKVPEFGGLVLMDQFPIVAAKAPSAGAQSQRDFAGVLIMGENVGFEMVRGRRLELLTPTVSR